LQSFVVKGVFELKLEIMVGFEVCKVFQEPVSFNYCSVAFDIVFAAPLFEVDRKTIVGMVVAVGTFHFVGAVAGKHLIGRVVVAVVVHRSSDSF
jgi:hypothetical protein